MKTLKSITFFLIFAVGGWAQIIGVTVSGVTPTQAVISYTSLNSSACQVEVSESPTYSPLVNDVNPAIFTGSDQDNRTGNPVQAVATSRVFVVGKRAVQTVSAVNHSRALQAYTRHYFRISHCGADLSTATGTFTTREVPIGASWGESIPNDGAGNYLWPTASGTRGATFTEPYTGALIKQLTLPTDIQGSSAYDMGATGGRQLCSKDPVTNSAGELGWHCIVWVYSSGNWPTLYFINKATGDATFLGSMATNYTSPGWNASYSCPQSAIGAHSFKPGDPNIFYCDVSGNNDPSGVGATGRILVKATYCGHNNGEPGCAPCPDCDTGVTDQPPQQGSGMPHTNYSPLWGNLASCDSGFATKNCPFNRNLLTLLSEFDPSGYGTCAYCSNYIPGDWAGGKYTFQIRGANQDTVAYVAQFDPAAMGGRAGCIDNGVGGNPFAGVPGCIVNDINTLTGPAGSGFRFGTLHTLFPTDASSWVQVWDNGFINGYGQAYRVTVSSGLSATPGTCSVSQPGGNPIPDWPDLTWTLGCDTITVTGDPSISPAITGMPNSIPALPGDILTLDSSKRGTLNSLNEPIRILSTSGTTWYVQRRYGNGFPNGGNGDGLGPPSYDSVAVNGTLELATLCNYRPCWWNPAASQGFSNPMPDPLPPVHTSWVDNGFQRVSVTSNATMFGWEPARLVPDAMATMPARVAAFNHPNFLDNTIQTLQVETHPSAPAQAPASLQAGIMAVDGNPFFGCGFGGVSGDASCVMNGATITNVTGNLYKITGTSIAANYKKWSYFANSGTHAMTEIGGPGSTVNMDGTSTYQYQWGVALANGEIRTGSTVGDVYFNAPSVTVSGCKSNWTALLAGSTPGGIPNDICISYANPVIAGVRVAAFSDPNALYNRTFISALGWPDNWTAFWNASATPDGAWLFTDLPTDRQIHLIKTTPSVDDSALVRRNTYVPVLVTVPPVASATNAIVEFGYNENGNPATSLNCMTRNEPCVAKDATIQTTAYRFSTLDAPIAGMSCAAGCTIAVPGISGRVLYYRWSARDSGNNVLSSSAIQATTVDPSPVIVITPTNGLLSGGITSGIRP